MHGFLMQYLYNITGCNEELSGEASCKDILSDQQKSLLLRNFYSMFCGNGNTEYMPSDTMRGTAVHDCYHGLGHAITGSIAQYRLHNALQECVHMKNSTGIRISTVSSVNNTTRITLQADSPPTDSTVTIRTVADEFKAYMCATGAYMEVRYISTIILVVLLTFIMTMHVFFVAPCSHHNLIWIDILFGKLIHHWLVTVPHDWFYCSVCKGSCTRDSVISLYRAQPVPSSLLSTRTVHNRYEFRQSRRR